jgi:hypothetical protein
MRCDAIFYTGTSPSLDTALSQAHRAASYLFPTHLFRRLSERFCILLLLGLVEQALLIFVCFCPCVFDIFPVAGQQCSFSFRFFLVMNVMQTQVTIAWESKEGNITSLAASKGQDSLVFFTHLTGPRWTRSTFPPRSRLLYSQTPQSLVVC